MSKITARTDFHVCTATGGLMKTFEDRILARKCAKDLHDSGAFPGCYVEEVEVTTVVRTVYRPQIKLAAVAS